MQLSDFSVRKISCKTAKEYIHRNHYSKGSHNGPFPCYGLYAGENLIGCLMFATPCSENVRASVFGKEFKNSVIELHRLHIQDGTPKNTESFFISKCLKSLRKDRPQTLAVISFADPTQGHVGTIYQASNFQYYGISGKCKFYLDENNRLRHPRQCGRNISAQEAKAKNWVPTERLGKHRYIYLLSHKYRKLLKLVSQPYPVKHATI
jgi:hypothetical protein